MLLGVDVGGTFTDAALLTPDRLVTAKAPTTTEDQSEGVLAAIRAALAAAGAEPEGVERFVHGMTVGTNALLEGRVPATALLATEGFADLEELGRQARKELYRLCARHPPPMVSGERRIAVPERTGPEGPLRALDEDVLRARLDPLQAVEAAAVCLLWGFRHSGHERRVAELVCERFPEVHVSTSHEAVGTFREYERCATTVVDAALSPLLRRYLERLAGRAAGDGLPVPEVMLSGGGVADAATASRHGSWTVLSGPAGGAVGAAALAARAGTGEAVCLDMGGTSCDVSVSSGGAAAMTGGREVGGRALAVPMVDVHTVGAGGGSIAWADSGGALRVGPRSAGADPGPACYGRGGNEPTVTDAHLVLGHLDAETGLAGGVGLNRGAAHDAVSVLSRELDIDLVAAAEGILRVATQEMARAVRVLTVERGRDPRSMALLAFGGAGPLHAAAIAEALGMRRVVAPRSSGVLSAVGLVAAERRRDLVESVLLRGDELTRDRVTAAVARLIERGRRDGGAPDGEVRASFDLRYAGQAHELTVPGDADPRPEDLRAGFEAAHERQYGHRDADARIELVTVRVALAVPAPPLPSLAPERATAAAGTRRTTIDGTEVDARVFDGPPERVEGPAVCRLGESTLLVPPRWTGGADADGTVVLEREG